MQVYDINLSLYHEPRSVVAESMEDAARIAKEHYWPTEIKEISLHAKFVIVQGTDDKKKD